jgi:hypothetical protein
MTTSRPVVDEEPAAWAVGMSVFAGTTMAVVGIFQVMTGLVAVINGNRFLVATHDYVFELNATTWGWIHLVIGALVAITGVALFSGSVAARMAGIFLVGLSMIANFLWLPYYPLWAIVIISIELVVIWALASSSLGNRA